MEVGLVCVFSRDPHDHQQIGDMAKSLLKVERSTTQSLVDEGISLVARIAPWVADPIATHHESGSRLLLVGRAWSGAKPVHPSQLLISYLQSGAAALANLGGSFALVLWHPRSREIEVITDRLGTQKVYIWRGRDTVLLATEIRALLQHSQVRRELDPVAVEQFLITSHLIDHRSLIRDVHLAPPGSIVRSTWSTSTRQTYWTPRIAPLTGEGLDACADRLAEVLAPAVRSRCGDSPLVLPVSGGLDSRSIVAFVPPPIAAAATACTFGPPECYDVRFGRRIARTLGGAFKHLPIPRDFFRCYLQPVQEMCDGEISIEALPMYRLWEAGDIGDSILTGYLGGVLSGGHILELDRLGNQQDRFDRVWRQRYQTQGFSESALQSVLLPERYRDVRGSTRAIMERAILSADAPTLDEKSLVVELHHRQARYISYFGRFLGARYRVEQPFLDVDVLDTFLSISLAHRRGQRAYRRMIVRHAPAFAAIPENKTLRPVFHADAHGLPTSPSRQPRDSRLPFPIRWRVNKTRTALGILATKLSRGWVGSNDRRSYAQHADSIRRVDPGWFRLRLLDDPIVADWFDTAALRRMLDEHMAKRYDHSIRINNVIALLNWRRTIGA
jgi:asparagine synthetase B (glutamine-hydrolysing)